MSRQEDSTRTAPAGTGGERDDTGNEAAREDERGDVAEPDAPTGVEENVGMSTILGNDAGTGVQHDASDE